MKLSDFLIKKLETMGYTHCFFVAGGNIMHILNSVRSNLICIPFAHEVGAAIATEYHNASQSGETNKAFCLVTAGPGLTNAITGIAGSWQESRELLIIGGQVKRSDLASENMRQRGIQEIDGCKLVSSITKHAYQLNNVSSLYDAINKIKDGSRDRKGPVFIEIPLDVQAEEYDFDTLNDSEENLHLSHKFHNNEDIDLIRKQLKSSNRPVVLLGGGINRNTSEKIKNKLEKSNIPLMTTYNGADRVNNRSANFFGRPNTWGMRYSNILIQQADFILALGTRLGLQQTGFNWQEFAPKANLIHVDIDISELNKGHPKTNTSLNVDANKLLIDLCDSGYLNLLDHQREWRDFCSFTKDNLPLDEGVNKTNPGYIKPYKFWHEISEFMNENSILIPCSSGSSFTSSYQGVTLPDGAQMISNKSQAAMGYGLSGAIGASIANPEKKTLLIEGDGGFLQNLQELAIAKKNDLNLGIYLWVNNGYASIRMTQKTYFKGAWLGCDKESGLGFPNWDTLFESFSIPLYKMNEKYFKDEELLTFIRNNKTYAVIVNIDPEQTFFPKISSKVTKNGSMISNPLHQIGPELSKDLQDLYMKYFKN